MNRFDAGSEDTIRLSKESYMSDNTQTNFVERPRKPTLLQYACLILIGIVIALTALSVAATLNLAAFQPRHQGHIPIDAHNHEPLPVDLGLNPALKPGEDPVENGYWCGTTPEEARAKGCKFDIILYSWVPPPCYDHEIQVAYMENRESEWYRNRGGEGGEKIPQERAALGVEPGLWLSWAYHDYHCQYIWKMMTRILRNSSMGVAGRLLEYYHTDHCINVLKGIEKGPDVDISTLVSLNYSTCYSRT